MPTNVGGSQAFVTERVTEGTSLPVGANLANSFIGVEIQGDTTPYKIDISSLSGRLSVTQEILGVIKPKGKGAYSAGTQYSLMDYVDSGNQHYLYIGDTPSTGTPLTDTTKWTPLLTDGVNGTNGTNGTNGVNAYTTTSATFTVPAINSAVTISVVNSAWMVSGQSIFIATAGLYTIASIISATSISATNTGASGNAAAAATISSGSAVSPGGRNGANGTSAIATTSSFTQPAINANVTVTVNSSAGFVDKQPLFHDLGGYYVVSGSPPSATTVTLKNLGYAGNIAASASVGAGTLVPSGIKGLDGSGGGGAVGLKFTLNTTAGTPAAGEIRSTNLAGGGTIAINPTDTQASASDILGRLGVGAIVDLRNSDSKWVRGTVTTAWTAGSGSFAIGNVRSAGAIANSDTVYLSIASDAPATVVGGTARVTMTADRTYYVRATGTRTGFLASETDATTNIDADAFPSPQAAQDAIARLDCNGFAPTISIGPGSFGPLDFKSLVGADKCKFVGSGSGTTTIGKVTSSVAQYYEIYALKVSYTSSTAFDIAVDIEKGNVYIHGDCIINYSNSAASGSKGPFIAIRRQGYARLASGITLTGSASWGLFCANGAFLDAQSSTVNFVSATIDTYQFFAVGVSYLELGGASINGTPGGTFAFKEGGAEIRLPNYSYQS